VEYEEKNSGISYPHDYLTLIIGLATLKMRYSNTFGNKGQKTLLLRTPVTGNTSSGDIEQKFWTIRLEYLGLTSA